MTAFFSPEVSSRATAVPPSFSARFARRRARAGADDQQAPRTVPLSSMNCSDALDASPSKRWRSSALRRACCAAPSDAERSSGPCRRPAGPAHNLPWAGCRRNEFACRLILERRTFARPLGCKPEPWQSGAARAIVAARLRCDRRPRQDHSRAGQTSVADEICLVVGASHACSALPLPQSAAGRAGACARPPTPASRPDRRIQRRPGRPTTAMPTSSPRAARCG